MNIRERIAEFLASKNLSDYQFEKEIGMSKGYMNKCVNPSAEVLDKICRKYPELSAEWLIRGEGEMLKRAEPEVPSCTEQEILTRIKTLSEKVEKMSSQIEEMKKSGKTDGNNKGRNNSYGQNT